MSTLKKIRLLIVDDSVLFRSQIHLALKDCPEIEIVGSAANGKIALEKMLTQEIDVCTLDIEMPVLDGLATLKEMRVQGLRTRAIMFSSQNRSGAQKTMEAMRIGAVDFIAKPLPDDALITPSEKIKEALLPKILSIFGVKSILNPIQPIFHHKIIWETFNPEVLVIASSTGGPQALENFFQNIREPLPFPVLITQHMPPVFTASLAERIGVITGKVSREAVHGEVLKPNQIYIAPGNFHMKIVGAKNAPIIQLDQGDQRNYVRPCADYLFETAAKIFGRHTLGVVLTGMGRDGADGATAIKNAQGAVMIQSEESCVVFGMPGAVFESGHFDHIGTPQELATKTMKLSNIRRAGHVA